MLPNPESVLQQHGQFSSQTHLSVLPHLVLLSQAWLGGQKKKKPFSHASQLASLSGHPSLFLLQLIPFHLVSGLALHPCLLMMLA
jgi:hypothetical protein